MFERKNQNILSEHYSKLISDDSGSDSDDDFITLKRVDHDLDDMASGLTRDDRPPTGPTGHSTTFEEDLAANLSKRKQKLGKAKRAIATGGVNTKLVFDDEGKPHQLYELEDGEKWFEERGGLLGAQEEGRKFAEGERSKMKVADVMDREEAKEKKREKKRKRKDRERAVSISSPPLVFCRPVLIIIFFSRTEQMTVGLLLGPHHQKRTMVMCRRNSTCLRKVRWGTSHHPFKQRRTRSENAHQVRSGKST